jgi:shikimate kinase
LNVIFIGPPGSGKTSVGQILALRTGRRFFDTDRLIEEENGNLVAEIFSSHGETHFRQLEANLLEEIANKKWSDVILATGGGIIVTPGNIERLEAIGHVVCLLAEPSCLAARLGADQSRPLLLADNHEGKVKRLTDLLETRMPLYRRATYTIETAGLNPEEVAKKVEELLFIS